MLQRDFIIREIQRAIRLLQAALGLIDARKLPEALQFIDEGFRDFFGVGSDFVNRVSLDYLVERLRTSGELDVEATWLMAGLLKLEGDVLRLQGQPTASFPRYRRAFRLMGLAAASGRASALPDEWTRRDEVADELSRFALPPDLAGEVAQHYEARGRFAAAETLLWERLDAAPEDAAILAEGLAFYERLLAQPDAALAAGDLPRAEVEAGHAEWQRAMQRGQ